MPTRLMLFAGMTAAAMALGTAAQARPASELACVEALFTDADAVAMAELGSDDKAVADAASKKLNFMRLGAASRTCALKGDWNENEYANSVGYVMAWPTARGLRLSGEAQGYAALERAYRARADGYSLDARLDDEQIAAVVAAAQADGLALAGGPAAKKDAKRYVDVLHQLTIMRADFAANRQPLMLRKK